MKNVQELSFAPEAAKEIAFSRSPSLLVVCRCPIVPKCLCLRERLFSHILPPESLLDKAAVDPGKCIILIHGGQIEEAYLHAIMRHCRFD
jgi:hypothetical protein